jgi:hypothetical protein
MRQAEYGNNTIQVSYPLVPPKAEIDWALLYFRFVRQKGTSGAMSI